MVSSSLPIRVQQGLAQTVEIPVRHLRLAVEGVAALSITVVADMAGVKRIEKLKRAVVNCQAQNAHIVGIHHPMAKAHRLPLRQHVRCALAYRLQKVGIGIAF